MVRVLSESGLKPTICVHIVSYISQDCDITSLCKAPKLSRGVAERKSAVYGVFATCKCTICARHSTIGTVKRSG